MKIVYKQVILMGLVAIVPLFVVLYISSGFVSNFGQTIVDENSKVTIEVLGMMSNERNSTVELASEAVESVSLDAINMMVVFITQKLNDDHAAQIAHGPNDLVKYVDTAIADLNNIKGLLVVVNPDGITKRVIGMNGFSTNLYNKRYGNNSLLETEANIFVTDLLAGNSGTIEQSFGGINSIISYRPLDNGAGVIVAIPTSIFDTPMADLERTIMIKEESITKQMESSLFKIESATINTSLVIKNYLLLVMLVIGVLSIILAYVFAKSMTDSLKKLTQAAMKVSEGDPHVEIPEIHSNDEIKDLADSLKSSLAAVKFLMDHAESKTETKKVKKRGK